MKGLWKLAREPSAEKHIIDKEMSKRFEKALDNHEHIPPQNFGRLAYIKDQLFKFFQIEVSRETVRKWLAGESRPRPDKMKALAQILKVDEAWLSLGINPSESVEEKRVRPAINSSAVAYVAGLVGMSGAMTAFPDQDDDKSSYTHFYAISKGRQHSFYVTMAERTQNGYKAVFPVDFERVKVIVVVPSETVNSPIYRLDSETLASSGKKRGGYVELSFLMDGEKFQVAEKTIKRVRRVSEIVA